MPTKHIRNSAKALITRDGRMLAIKIDDEGDIYYVMPGGGQHGGELAFVIEGRDGEAFHRVDLIFQCEFLGFIEGSQPEGDTRQVGVEWLPIGDLHSLPLYPSKLRRQIQRLYGGEPHSIYLGNENRGRHNRYISNI